MNGWHCLNLGDALLADAPLRGITEFAAARAHGEEAAVFYRHRSEGRLHCEVVVYFSPAAAAIAHALDARSCPRPAAHGLGLLAGDAGARLFADRG